MCALGYKTLERSGQFEKKSAFDGADDGGSGVGVLLEIARLLSTQQAGVGIDIALFDVEDYGPPEWEAHSGEEQPIQYCLGTQHWAENPHVENYRAYFGILLDMVGAKMPRSRRKVSPCSMLLRL